MAEFSETLTFLFTDLEGSTRLWEEHPEAMRLGLAQHDGLVRDAVETHGGLLVKSTGDGALATFRSAFDGVSAAITAQRALGDAEWPEGAELRVRMGLHTGEATERQGDWFGADVNRAARVMGVAHGGQIVCTDAVAAQVRDRVGLVDLGEHRLRDLQLPVQVFQVQAPGLDQAFPPLRSLDAYRSNLPYEVSSFIGRDEELRGLGDRVRTSRVASIVGVGGVGKTRLALQVGAEVLPHFADGVWLCELAQVLDPDDLPAAIATAVGYVPPQGVPVTEGLPRFLERKHLLLILDNCEHLVRDTARWVTATTATAARVSVLATSREALGVRGEHISPLASLTVPDAMDATGVMASEAGALFVARAEEARGSFVLDDTNTEAVRDLCARLDGIALAIELVAARTKMMTPAEILTRLDTQFALLTGGQRTSLERHQTLRAAIDWSYDLLSDEERSLLNRLSVCVGGFDLDAAIALAAGIGVDEFDGFELLELLVGKSLVERNERDGRTRYRILEMIRHYATEKLTTTHTTETARDDHAHHYLALANRLFADTATAADYDALAQIETETPNIAAAARWLMATDRSAELLVFFERLPFLDAFAWPSTTLDELGGIAHDAITRGDTGRLPGFESACRVADSRAYSDGDLDAFTAITDLAWESSQGEPLATTLCSKATALMLLGDTNGTVTKSTEMVARARLDDDPVQLSWMLAYHALMLSVDDQPGAAEATEESLAIARRTRSRLCLLYPLLAAAVNVTGVWGSGGTREAAAASELLDLDRTPRGFYRTQARTTLALHQVGRGEVLSGLTMLREELVEFIRKGERTILSIYLAGIAVAVADIDPHAAIELAALAESPSIAPFPAFSNMTALAELAGHHPAEVAAARRRTAHLDYDQWHAAIQSIMDRLIAEHDPARPPAPPKG